MGIKVKLDVVLARRNMTLTQLSERIGVTLANLSVLKTGKGKAIRFSTLEAICHELHCQPGDTGGKERSQGTKPLNLEKEIWDSET